jgi:hypothetical protein
VPQDDEDVYILSKVVDILHSFFGTHKESFMPVFEKVMPFFAKMLVRPGIFIYFKNKINKSGFVYVAHFILQS